MNYQLENKRALVTGGSRGIGASIVRRLEELWDVHEIMTFVIVRFHGVVRDTFSLLFDSHFTGGSPSPFFCCFAKRRTIRISNNKGLPYRNYQIDSKEESRVKSLF